MGVVIMNDKTLQHALIYITKMFILGIIFCIFIYNSVSHAESNIDMALNITGLAGTLSLAFIINREEISITEE